MAQRLMTVRILWFSLLVSTAMFLVVLVFAKNPEPNRMPILPPAFGVMALGLAVLSFVIPGQVQRTACARASLQLTEQADPNASSVIPYRDAPKRLVFADLEQASRAAFVAYQPAMIIGCSLCEAIALSGFVIAYMGHPLPLALPFFALSWLLFALRFPTLARVRGPLEKAKGAVFSS